MLTKKELIEYFSASYFKTLIDYKYQTDRILTLEKTVRELADACYDAEGMNIVKPKEFMMGMLSCLRQAISLCQNNNVPSRFLDNFYSIIKKGTSFFLNNTVVIDILNFYVLLFLIEPRVNNIPIRNEQIDFTNIMLILLVQQLSTKLQRIYGEQLDDFTDGELSLLEHLTGTFLKFDQTPVEADERRGRLLDYTRSLYSLFSNNDLFTNFISSLHKLCFNLGRRQYYQSYQNLNVLFPSIPPKSYPDQFSYAFEKLICLAWYQLDPILIPNITTIIMQYLADTYYSNSDQPIRLETKNLPELLKKWEILDPKNDSELKAVTKTNIFTSSKTPESQDAQRFALH